MNDWYYALTDGYNLQVVLFKQEPSTSKVLLLCPWFVVIFIIPILYTKPSTLNIENHLLQFLLGTTASSVLSAPGPCSVWHCRLTLAQVVHVISIPF